MVDAAQLLPPNRTRLEAALARTAPRELLGALADLPAGIKAVRPGAFTPWLAAEWWLADFSAYFDSPAELIDAGLPWLQVRGTADAVKLALSWIGFAATLDEDGAYLHLDPGTPDAPARLADIRRLVEASIPANVRFYRLFHGYDLRHARLDSSRLDDCLLDDDSGVWADGIKLSFGTRAAAALPIEADPPISTGRLAAYSSRLWDDDSWRMDAWRLDSEVMIDAAGRVIAQVVHVLPADADDAPIADRVDVIAATVAAADTPAPAVRTDAIASTLPDPLRTWHGAWLGPWREPVPSTMTTLFE